MSIFQFITDELEKIKEQGLFRSLKGIDEVKGSRIKIDGKKLINFCSNNYLGLANNPRVTKKASEVLKKFGAGSGASRLVSGNLRVHEELEHRIAKFEGAEAAIIFPTGYMANIGTIQALVGAGDAVVIDRLNHASIIDGARLSGAKMLVYAHRDMDQLEKVLKSASGLKKKLIVTDYVFSMDGDLAPLDEMVNIAKRNNAMLMIDTAHSTGVMELKVQDARLKTDIIIMGTLSKAIGSLGGFIAGSGQLIEYLRNKARAFIYTTALPPAVAAASIASFDIIENDDSLRKKLWKNVEYLKKKLEPLGLNTLDSKTQIVPIMIGDARKTMEASNYLYLSGIFLSAIRPPTVPQGTSRLRLTVTAMHTKEDIDLLIEKLAEVKEKFNG
jgi:glycine C-acetyltransferase/8-amino-7-oxononanoate synthase